MKKLLFLLFLLAAGLRGFAQNDTLPPKVTGVATAGTPDSSQIVYNVAEIMPEFPGGEAAFFEYLQRSIHYPKEAKMNNRQGTVYVTFVVEKDGSISHVETVKGVPGAPDLSKEAERVIATMPNWHPGRMDGKPVRVQLTQPIKFVLTSGKKR